MRSSGRTDKGRTRSLNQDSIHISDGNVGGLRNLYVVADGMGGCNAGEVASSDSISFLLGYLNNVRLDVPEPLDYLIDAVVYSNNQVYKKSLSDISLTGMGTTFSACTIVDSKLYIAHIGDSRVYSILNDKINLLTNDHSFVYEMMKAGQLTENEAIFHPKKNMLTRALGEGINTPVDGIIHNLSENECILICSDGLSNMLRDAEILEIIKSIGLSDIDRAAESLVKAANDNGGIDNISVVLIDTVR